jgi:uncharacterized protein YggE
MQQMSCNKQCQANVGETLEGSERKLGEISRKGNAMHPSNATLNKHSSCALGVAVFFTLLLSPALSPAMAQTPPPRTLSITGSAEVHVAPDVALVSVGVVVEGATAAGALKDNSAALTKALDAMRAAGIEAKDMQTHGLSLEPRYERLDKPGPNDRPRIIGYSAVNLVSVRVRDLAKLGDLLDKIAAAGVNRIDSIRFIVSNQDKLLDEARQNAVADAKQKADLYARAAGFTVGKVMSLNEEGAPNPVPPPMMMARAMAGAPPPVPVEAGEMTLTVRVHIVWSLAD